MRTLYSSISLSVLIVFVILLCQCTRSGHHDSIEQHSDSLNNAKDLTNQSHSFDTTLMVNSKTFDIRIRDINQELALLTVNSEILDTLYTSGLGSFEFIDFNKDSYPDIMVNYIGNNTLRDLFLFDPVTNKFKKVQGFIDYSDSYQLKSDPEYYYSYDRAGCADLNWVSDFYKIENFKIIHLGHMYAQGCEDEPQGIEIYKILNNDEHSKKLVERLPYLKEWQFIENYWNKNYSRFK
jgi:hypothetical protein